MIEGIKQASIHFFLPFQSTAFGSLLLTIVHGVFILGRGMQKNKTTTVSEYDKWWANKPKSVGDHQVQGGFFRLIG